jgi:CheY-like chemotaxis protein
VIEELRPALLFLDVQMPDDTGFAVLGQLSQEVTPLTLSMFGRWFIC